MAIGPGVKIGQYVVEKKIGEGGMGAVFLADQPSINRRVVLKVLSTGLAGDREMLERFKREVDIIAQLEHPHILPVYDFGVVEGDPYIVMRYMGGGSLHDHLKAQSLGRDALLNILDHVAEALDYAHDRDIIHRDLKPGNVLLDDSQNGYLADFGLAKTMEGSRDLTKTGSVLGTPAYMSPEQARGEHLDARSDVYSFAIMAFEALSGAKPFDAKTPMEFIRKHLSEPPRSIRTLARDLPPAVDSTLNRALAKNPDARPARATIFMQELRASLKGQAPAAAAAPAGAAGMAQASAAGQALRRPSRRRWALPAIVLGVAGVGIVGLGILAAVLYFVRGPLTGPAAHTYPVGDSPRAILPLDGEMWVANGFDGTLVELQAQGCQDSEDPCGEALGTYPVDDLPVGLALLDGRLWVAGALHQTLTPFDPDTHQSGQSIQLPSVPSALLEADGSLWALSDIGGTLMKVDPQSGEVDQYKVGEGVQSLVHVGDALWIANSKANSVMRVDPKTGAISSTVSLEGGPTSLAFDGALLWVALADADSVAAVDVGNGSVLANVAVEGHPVALAFDGRFLWVATQRGNDLVQIAVDTGEVVQTVPVSGGPYAVRPVSCGTNCFDVWVVGEAGDSVSRVRFK
jgi:YVTN family beta-propeller protein